LRIEPFIRKLFPKPKLWKRFQIHSVLMHNRPMNSLTTLELQENSHKDLHYQMTNCNLVRLQLLDGSSRELTTPTLGRDFLAGYLEDEKTIGVYRSSILRSIRFETIKVSESSRLEYTQRTIGELMGKQRFPVLARVGYLEPKTKPQQLRLIGVARGLLFTDYYQSPAIPIAALGSIELKL